MSSKGEFLSKTDSTTFFNYRRMNETKIAASNNSASYFLNDKDYSTPEMGVTDLDGNKLINIELVSR